MDLEAFRAYCLAKKAVTEELPFGPDALVFKVMGKMFALCSLDAIPFRFSLKNTPDKNVELRERYPAIQGAYHMNKTHWSMVEPALGGISESLIKELIDDSYELVVAGLTKKQKLELDNLME